MNIKVGDLVTIREDLKEGKYGADSVVESMLKYCGKSFKVAKVINDEKKVVLNGVPWNWTPEMLVDKPSGKIIGYRCLNTGGKDSWWSVGKVYKVYKKHGQEFIIDDEGDNHYREDLSEILDNTKNDYTSFELVEESCPKRLSTIAQVKAKIKAAQEVANKAYEEIGRLEADLEVLEEYK